MGGDARLSSRHDYDESDVRIRSGRGSRPRTKTRPEHADAEQAMVVTVDRGRWGCVLDGDPHRLVTAMRARELALLQEFHWRGEAPAGFRQDQPE